MLPPTVPTPTIALFDGSGRFQIRRIFCVGQNYADHAREMGGNPERQEPFFFSKPADAVVASDSKLHYPRRTEDLQHEVELVLALGLGGSDVDVAVALDLIFGCAVGVDLTRRDLQAAAKQAGHPWDMAKGFDRSAPVGPLVRGTPPVGGRIALSVDGAVRQNGRLSDMIWSPAEIIATLSTYVELAPGDLLFTGTPAGVGPLQRGEKVIAEIEGMPPLTFDILG